MRSNEPRGSNSHSFNPEQRTLDFNPIEATPEERERLRRLALQWTLEEAAEDFQQLPGETVSEWLRARERYVRDLETFGPLFPPQTSEAWEIVQGLRRTALPEQPPQQPRQLKLPFDDPNPNFNNDTTE